jgi:TldD protein
MAGIDHPLHRRRFLGILGGAAAATFAGPLDRLLSPAEVRAQTFPGMFPIDGGMASRILAEARARGAGFSEIYLETRAVTRLNLSERSIESVEQGIYAGCGVRAIDGDRIGYAYADSFEEPKLIEAARNAAAIATSTSTPAAQALAFQLENPQPRIRYLRPFDAVSDDERVGWLKQADEAARAYDPAVNQVTIECNDEMLRYAVINSDGIWLEDTLPLLYLRVNVNAAKGERRSMGLERLSRRLGAEQMDQEAPANTAREAARMAIAMLDAGPAPAGEMPVVLAAGGGVMFHEAVGHGLEGDAVRKGTSMFAGKVGQVVAADRVSIVDWGGIADLRGSYNVDDEGTVPQQTILIERGVLTGFLTDRINAQSLDSGRTGNGRRQSYRFPPLVRMSNTFLYQGEDDVDQMVRDTKSGLFARNLGGGEVDTTTGNFTFGVLEAYRIEDGKIGAPVRGAVLVGNGPEIMKRIDRVGPDLKFWPGTCGKGQWVPVTAGAPTLRISSMTVGGSE